MPGARCWVLGAVLGAASPAFAQDPPKPRAFEIRGYFTAGSEKTESPKTFDAVLGADRFTLIGGGGELIVKRRWILRGQYATFSDTGTRVFVDPNRVVFPLNIPLDVTIGVTDLSAGYRFVARPRWGAYAAGGWTRYVMTEKSTGETDKADGTGWHALGGMDVRVLRWIFAAGELQWTKTEDIFSGGAAEALGESRLGGLRIAGRIGLSF